jgi:hypothetical protein
LLVDKRRLFNTFFGANDDSWPDQHQRLSFIRNSVIAAAFKTRHAASTAQFLFKSKMRTIIFFLTVFIAAANATGKQFCYFLQIELIVSNITRFMKYFLGIAIRLLSRLLLG